MGYKLKRILIYPDGVTEKQVYPAKYKYEYSYDFRNKSTTILTNDGWTVGSGLSFDSNGAYNSSFTNTARPIGVDITNAKKIILNAGLYNANSCNCGFGLWETTSASGTHAFGAYTEGYSSGNSNLSLDGAQVQSFSMSEPSGQSEWTYTLDFENLTYSWVYNGTTKSGTMTQTQADGMRNNNTALRFAIQYTGGRLQYIKFHAEY